jgi:hypothetical protein
MISSRSGRVVRCIMTSSPGEMRSLRPSTTTKDHALKTTVATQRVGRNRVFPKDSLAGAWGFAACLKPFSTMLPASRPTKLDVHSPSLTRPTNRSSAPCCVRVSDPARPKVTPQPHQCPRDLHIALGSFENLE